MGRVGVKAGVMAPAFFFGAHPTVDAPPGSTGRVTDDELVRLARAGDAGAFDQLVVRHQAAVFRAALAALRAREDAEEAAQDALVRAWKNLDGFRGQSSFRTWLLSIAWNRAISRRRSVVRWFARRAPLADADGVVGGAAGPLDALGQRELAQQVAAAIDALSPKLRDALLLAQSGDYGYDEVAAMLNVPVGTVKWRVSDARRRVKERLAALGYVPKDRG